MTLVSIIGEFCSSIIPVFYYYKDKITHHIIVTLPQNKNVANDFKVGIENFSKKHNLKIKNEIFFLDEDMISSLNKLILKIPNNSIINTTDGLSFINSYLSINLNNAKFVSYNIFENQMIVFDKNTFSKLNPPSISIKDFFILRNIEITSIGNKEYAKKYQKEIKEIFEKNHNDFIRFKSTLSKNSSLPPRKDFFEIYKILDKMNIGNDYNDVFQLITGTLFEYYVYVKLKEFGFDDIEIGVKVKINNVENEFDLLVMEQNHLHIIECKHKFFRTLNLAELIYKYHSLRSIIDYDARAVIVSLVKKYSQNFINRALNFNVGLFDIQHVENINEFLRSGKYNIQEFRL